MSTRIPRVTYPGKRNRPGQQPSAGAGMPQQGPPQGAGSAPASNDMPAMGGNPAITQQRQDPLGVGGSGGGGRPAPGSGSPGQPPGLTRPMQLGPGGSGGSGFPNQMPGSMPGSISTRPGGPQMGDRPAPVQSPPMGSSSSPPAAPGGPMGSPGGFNRPPGAIRPAGPIGAPGSPMPIGAPPNIGPVAPPSGPAFGPGVQTTGALPGGGFGGGAPMGTPGSMPGPMGGGMNPGGMGGPAGPGMGGMNPGVGGGFGGMSGMPGVGQMNTDPSSGVQIGHGGGGVGGVASGGAVQGHGLRSHPNAGRSKRDVAVPVQQTTQAPQRTSLLDRPHVRDAATPKFANFPTDYSDITPGGGIPGMNKPRGPQVDTSGAFDRDTPVRDMTPGDISRRFAWNDFQRDMGSERMKERYGGVDLGGFRKWLQDRPERLEGIGGASGAGGLGQPSVQSDPAPIAHVSRRGPAKEPVKAPTRQRNDALDADPFRSMMLKRHRANQGFGSGPSASDQKFLDFMDRRSTGSDKYTNLKDAINDYGSNLPNFQPLGNQRPGASPQQPSPGRSAGPGSPPRPATGGSASAGATATAPRGAGTLPSSTASPRGALSSRPEGESALSRALVARDAQGRPVDTSMYTQEELSGRAPVDTQTAQTAQTAVDRPSLGRIAQLATRGDRMSLSLPGGRGAVRRGGPMTAGDIVSDRFDSQYPENIVTGSSSGSAGWQNIKPSSGSGSGGNQAQSPQDALYDKLDQAWQEQREKNERRYEDIRGGESDPDAAEGGYKGRRERVLGRQDEIVQGFQDRFDRNLGRLDASYDVARRDLGDRTAQRRGRSEQDLISRGLGNTTVRGSMLRGIDRDHDRGLFDILADQERARFMMDSALSGDQLASQQRRADADAGLSGDTLRFMERRTDPSPDLGQTLALAARHGAATPFTGGIGGIGGGQSYPIKPINPLSFLPGGGGGFGGGGGGGGRPDGPVNTIAPLIGGGQGGNQGGNQGGGQGGSAGGSTGTSDQELQSWFDFLNQNYVEPGSKPYDWINKPVDGTPPGPSGPSGATASNPGIDSPYPDHMSQKERDTYFKTNYNGDQVADYIDQSGVVDWINKGQAPPQGFGFEYVAEKLGVSEEVVRELLPVDHPLWQFELGIKRTEWDEWNN